VEKSCNQTRLQSNSYPPSAALPYTIHLDERVFRYLSEKAEKRGVPLDDLVNDLLKKSIELSWRLT